MSILPTLWPGLPAVLIWMLSESHFERRIASSRLERESEKGARPKDRPTLSGETIHNLSVAGFQGKRSSVRRPSEGGVGVTQSGTLNTAFRLAVPIGLAGEFATENY